MPITRKQFELGVDEEITDFMRKIHGFLSVHKNEAYNIDEISNMVLGGPNPFITLKIRRALDKLVEIDAVQERTIKDNKYYAFFGLLNL